MGLFDPAWIKDNEEAAIRAIQKERKDGKLIQAASFALSYSSNEPLVLRTSIFEYLWLHIG